MSLKTHIAKNQTNLTARWQQKIEESYSKEQEQETDAKFYQRENIGRRIKQAGIKSKAVFRGKLADDDKPKQYLVLKVDNRSGEVTLKNDQGTVRKVNAMDRFFGVKSHRGQQ